MKNIILISPPAAGKGTQSIMLKEKYNIPIISVSGLIKEAVKNRIEGYQEIEEAMKSGNLVKDEITSNLLKIRLKKEDCVNGYILDGYPRNLIQAQFYDNLLEELGNSLGYVIYFDIEKEELKKRIVGRLTCSSCGKIYNSNFNDMKPINEELCDICKNPLVTREDDNEDSFEIRYKTYLDNTYPLVDYYRKKGLLYTVDSSISKEFTFNQIEAIINGEKQND